MSTLRAPIVFPDDLAELTPALLSAVLSEGRDQVSVDHASKVRTPVRTRRPGWPRRGPGPKACRLGRGTLELPAGARHPRGVRRARRSLRKGWSVRLLGWFQLLSGAAMIGLWTLLLATGQVPELEAGQRDILFHLLAELLAATALLVAGSAVLRRHERGTTLSAFALGALLYTSVNSSGYYAETGDWAAVGMFGVLAVCALLSFRRCISATTSGGGAPAAETVAPATRT
jgi:hypothetical protein